MATLEEWLPSSRATCVFPIDPIPGGHRFAKSSKTRVGRHPPASYPLSLNSLRLVAHARPRLVCTGRRGWEESAATSVCNTERDSDGMASEVVCRYRPPPFSLASTLQPGHLPVVVRIAHW